MGMEREKIKGVGCIKILSKWVVSVSNDGKVQEMDNGDGCITLWKHLMPMNYTPKNG